MNYTKILAAYPLKGLLMSLDGEIWCVNKIDKFVETDEIVIEIAVVLGPLGAKRFTSVKPYTFVAMLPRSDDDIRKILQALKWHPLEHLKNRNNELFKALYC
jgi:hypothetical protein